MVLIWLRIGPESELVDDATKRPRGGDVKQCRQDTSCWAAWEDYSTWFLKEAFHCIEPWWYCNGTATTLHCERLNCIALFREDWTPLHCNRWRGRNTSATALHFWEPRCHYRESIGLQLGAAMQLVTWWIGTVAHCNATWCIGGLVQWWHSVATSAYSLLPVYTPHQPISNNTLQYNTLQYQYTTIPIPYNTNTLQYQYTGIPNNNHVHLPTNT